MPLRMSVTPQASQIRNPAGGAIIGDAIFPGGNDYPAKELGLDTVRVRDPEETLSVIAAIVACQKAG